MLLEGPDGPVTGPAAQQRRLALLALLGAAGDRGRSRDQLISLLWPETDAREARQHLSHSLYALRKSLGEEVVRTAGEYVRLSLSLIEVDSSTLERALDRGARETAVLAYGGPFMDGFFIDDAHEFERWVEDERLRLAALYARALEKLGREANESGEPVSAAEWWGRLVAHDPWNSAAIVHLMEALAAAGDPANAVQVAREHVERVRRELGMEPAPEVSALADSLMHTVPVKARIERDLEGAPEIESVRVPVGALARGRQPRSKRILGLALLGVFTVAVLLAVRGLISSRELTRHLVSTAVMVLPMENLTADRSLDDVGRYAAYVIEGGLAEIDSVRVVRSDEAERVRSAIEQSDQMAGLALTRAIARQTRARFVVESSMHALSDSVMLEARLIDIVSGEVLEGVQAGAAIRDPAGGIRSLADRVKVSLATRFKLGDQYAGSYGRGQSYRAWQEVDAAREIWLEGGREREALAHLYRALQIDSTFDAALGLAMIWHLNFGEYSTADSLTRVLETRIAVISPRQRWQLAVNKAVLRRDRAAMLQAFRDWKDRLPSAARWLHLAMAASVAQRPGECLAALERVDLQGSRYAESGWLWAEYATCQHSLGNDRVGLDQARRGRERFIDDPRLAYLEARALAALGRSEEAQQVVTESLSQPAATETFQHESTFALLVGPALEMRAHGFTEAAAESLDFAVEWYRESLRGLAAGPAGRWRFARVLYAAGRWEEARDVFEDLVTADLAEDEQLLHHNIDISLLGYRATLAVRLGDNEAAGSIDDELARISRPYLWGHTDYWRAAIAAVSGEPDEAVGLLAKAMNRGLFAEPWGTEYPKWDFQIDPDFESLRDYPPFQELIAPRG